MTDNTVDRSGQIKVLQSLLENIDGGVEICECSDGLPICYISRGFERLTGYSMEDLDKDLNRSHIALIYSADREKALAVMGRQLVETGYCDIEYRIVRKDGSLLWVMDKGTLTSISDSGERRMQRILTDISRQKLVEQELRISEKRYELVMNFVDATIFDYNIETKQMHLHRRDTLEYNLPRVLDNAVEALIDTVVQPRSHSTMRRLYRAIEQGTPSASAVIYAQNEEGAEQVLEIKLATIYDDDCKPVGAVGVHRDITENVRMKREMEYGYSLVLGKQFIYEADITSNLVINTDEKWADSIELPQHCGYAAMIERFCKAEMADDYREVLMSSLSNESIASAYEQGERLLVLQYRQHNVSEGHFGWREMTVNIIKDKMSDCIVARGYIANIDQQKQGELRQSDERQELIYKSQHDLLTGLYNKATMSEKVDMLLKKNTGESLMHAFLLIDLDRFKEINDNFGHLFGDDVLSRFCARLRTLFRQGDLLGRIGGDEFCAMMCNLHNRNDALAKAKEVCDRSVEFYNKDGVEYKLSASVGVAYFSEHGVTMQQLYANADIALYEAKRRGRTCSVEYIPQMSASGASAGHICDHP